MEHLRELKEISDMMVCNVDTSFVRYLDQRINWNDRLIGIKGPRGIGKTTLILQRINRNLDINDTLYVVADHFYFSDHRLYDLAMHFADLGGKYLFIDEIHKYKDWSRELKLIYDFRPTLRVVFTGSSMLDIERGEEADLSRRAVMYDMEGLSFREYLSMFHHVHLPTYSLSELLCNEVSLPKGFLPLEHFQTYLQQGYYPFANQGSFPIRLGQVVQKTIEVDIPYYANMNVSTAAKLKQLLSIIARSVPFKPNYQKLSQMLDVNRAQIKDYLLYMEKAGLISQLRDSTKGIRLLGKVDKIYLSNTALAYLLGGHQTDIGNVRETFFYSQLRNGYDVLSSSISDFQIEDKTFEIGGINKGQLQIHNAAQGYVVKDNITTGMGNIIPLWHFGLLY